MKVYIAVGHGSTSTGGYQPGAVAPDGTQEHKEAHRVVDSIARALGRSGVGYFVESDSGNSHDPNYKGSAAAVNAGGFDLAVEVHFDCFRCGQGGFGLWSSAADGALAAKIGARYISLGLATRADQRRTDLYFLNATNCPAVVWECDFVHKLYDEEASAHAEAIAAGICDAIGKTYVPPSPIPPTPPTLPAQEDEEDMFFQERPGGYDSDGDGVGEPTYDNILKKSEEFWVWPSKVERDVSVLIFSNSTNSVIRETVGRAGKYLVASVADPHTEAFHSVVSELDQPLSFRKVPKT